MSCNRTEKCNYMHCTDCSDYEVGNLTIPQTEGNDYAEIDREYINAKIYEAMHFRDYKLNSEKINSIDDCKKVLKFLCDLIIKPIQEGVSYKGFENVKEYFED